MEEHVRPPSPATPASSLSADVLRELQMRASAAISTSREQAIRLEAEITRELDEILAVLNEQDLVIETADAENARRLAAQVDELTNEISALRRELHAEQERRERESAELEGKCAATQADYGAVRRERDELAAQMANLSERHTELEDRHRTAQEEWRKQLLGFESKLREQQSLWNEQRADWSVVRTTLERERDELQSKFKLALDDVQRLRERVAELEHDLARRPEAAQTDSAELVSLRAERDSLCERVAELEQRPTNPLDPDAEQELADLQRRFEMAVEDVRELKIKNARLESQLAAAGNSASGSAPDSGGMDWESQKRRLLAALSEGDDGQDGYSAQERATIEGTIEMTDAVVAEKDRQIAELMAEIEAARSESPAASFEDDRLKELLDTDEVIAQHRQRAQQLEREMEEKLRATELELSVERAKIARQKAELEDLRNHLESQRQKYEPQGGSATVGAPRRRWLSKLGIDGKEKE